MIKWLPCVIWIINLFESNDLNLIHSIGIGLVGWDSLNTSFTSKPLRNKIVVSSKFIDQFLQVLFKIVHLMRLNTML